MTLYVSIIILSCAPRTHSNMLRYDMNSDIHQLATNYIQSLVTVYTSLQNEFQYNMVREHATTSSKHGFLICNAVLVIWLLKTALWRFSGSISRNQVIIVESILNIFFTFFSGVVGRSVLAIVRFRGDLAGCCGECELLDSL